MIRDWIRGFFSLWAVKDLVRLTGMVKETLSWVYHLDYVYRLLEDRIEKLEEENKLLKDKLNSYNEQVEEYTEKLSTSLEEIDNNLVNVLNNDKGFDSYLLQADKTMESLLEKQTAQAIDSGLQAMGVLEQEVRIRPAIGSKGVKAKQRALRQIEEHRAKLANKKGTV